MLLSFLLTLSCTPFVQEASLQKSSAQEELNVSWNDGLRWSDADGDVTGRLLGFFQWDSAYLANDAEVTTRARLLNPGFGALEDGAQVRRARIGWHGTLSERLDYRLEFDFVPGVVQFTDVSAGLKIHDWQLRIGRFKEPFGLEFLAPPNATTFMERSSTALLPGRSAGVMAHGTFGDRLNWATGVFRSGTAQGLQRSDADWSWTARLAGALHYEKQGLEVLHLGMAWSRRQPNAGMLRYRQRPGAFLAPFLADTGNFSSNGVNLADLEFAWVWGGLTVQTEYIFSDADRTRFSDSEFHSYYAQISYFLTEHHRFYNPRGGRFEAVRSGNVFTDEDFSGAWEMKARWSSLDLDAGRIRGGGLNDLTVGLNYYFVPGMRLMLEGTSAAVETAGRFEIVQLRVDLSF